MSEGMTGERVTRIAKFVVDVVWWFMLAAMPIQVNLDLMLVQRGMTLSELAERIGITLPNLSILKTNKARAIRFSTLDAICHALDCQPGDLLEHVEEA